MEKTKAGDRRRLPKRFYKHVTIQNEGDAFFVHLDGRQLRTPQRVALRLPTRELAEAVMEEWHSQTDVIDPETMPMTKLCNSALDGVVPNRAAVIDDMVNYAKHDAVCYRANEPETLVTRQNVLLDPIIDWAEARLGLRWVCTAGVMPVAQPKEVDDVVRSALVNVSAFRLAALHEFTTLTGSTLLALAYDQKPMSCEDVWVAAHVDEDFQIERWGQDAEAQDRRQARWRDAVAADRLYQLAHVKTP